MYTKKVSLPTCLACLGLALGAAAQDIEVDFLGQVQSSAGQPLAGAAVTLLESGLSATTDAYGGFQIRGIVASVSPRGTESRAIRVQGAGGNLEITNPGRLPVRLELFSLLGARLWEAGNRGDARFRVDLRAGRVESKGLVLLRVTAAASSFTVKMPDLGNPGLAFSITAQDAGRSAAARLGKRAAGAVKLTLEVKANGHITKRFPQANASAVGLLLRMLPTAATRKERIRDLIGPDRTFRLGFLTQVTGENAYSLNYVDFEEMAGDTMPTHAFPDSKGAILPSWSPDGRMLAYETGREGNTVASSRIYLQPLQGARADGPAYPATNPRWWSSAADTFLVWCTSGKSGSWSDLSAATLKQKFQGAALTGAPAEITKGAFNGGLSRDGRYLASAWPWAVTKDLQTQELRYLHVYPGHPKVQGENTDSLQVCNPAISPDPASPSRMMFLDFGVPSEPSYPNLITPKLYQQHRMILIGDYLSDLPGRIVDFIDTPADELALSRTWEDPEWSNLADYAVATTRDANGATVTQPDIYIIKVSTKETVKVLSRSSAYQPVLWLSAGPSPLPDDSQIKLVSPSGGETFKVGDTLRVKWELQGKGFQEVTGVDMYLSPDNGKRWGLLRTNSILPKHFPIWGNYAWTIPDSITIASVGMISVVGEKCLLRVEQYSTTDANQVTTGKPFTIKPK